MLFTTSDRGFWNLGNSPPYTTAFNTQLHCTYSTQKANKKASYPSRLDVAYPGRVHIHRVSAIHFCVVVPLAGGGVGGRISLQMEAFVNGAMPTRLGLPWMNIHTYIH